LVDTLNDTSDVKSGCDDITHGANYNLYADYNIETITLFQFMNVPFTYCNV